MNPTRSPLLALHGGEPTIPEGPPPWPKPSPLVQEALLAAYADGTWGRYHGPHAERLQSALTQLCGCKYVWPCSSGTIAVELALRGLKVGPGDEVILAAYDFPGNFRSIEATGARPVLVDLAADSWTIDSDQAAAAITSQTKAIIASHLHGSLADMPRLRQIADTAGVALVEDVCQAPGAVIAGKPAGCYGDCAVLSFGGSKLLTAGRGGAVVTHREDVLQRIKIYSERGNNAFPLSELQAAVLLPQIEGLAAANQARLMAVQMLLSVCGELEAVQALQMPDSNSVPAFYKLPWLVHGSQTDDNAIRAKFVEALKAEGVAVDAGFRGFARRTNQRCRVIGDLTNARKAAAATVILHHPVLLEPAETISRVAAAIRKVAEHFS